MTHLVVAHARTRPDAVAVEEAGRRLTYGDLDRVSGELAWRLSQLGVTRGSVCGKAGHGGVSGLDCAVWVTC